ncbi:conserved hypothetical protein [Ricinus communis]|uniref:Uncharacterized protein n=1 Tax=Ricinus communis TaxID=3988 RepID=B9RGL6_RICCO|nr:conserved hypothetical protein [Ricinus communis]
MSRDGKDLLKRCLVKKPEFRFTAEMLLDHPFISGLDDTKSTEFGETLDKGCVSDTDIWALGLDDIKSSELEEILDGGCVSNADNEFDDSSCPENWSTSEKSSLEESDHRLHCSSPEFIGLGDQGSSIVITGQNFFEVAGLICR